MESKFWNIRGRGHLPAKPLRLGFGCKQLPGLLENVTLLPKYKYPRTSESEFDVCNLV